MSAIPGFVGLVLDEEVSSTLERRQEKCIQCDNQNLQCPESCPNGQVCILTFPDCQTCAQAICQVDSDFVSEPANTGGQVNVGAIAGGVVGGLAFIAILTYLVWRFCIKAKRGQQDRESWRQDAEYQTKEGMENGQGPGRTNRHSTHTINSIASTVLTRASNIIQIAYIPGVTNRATPTSPTLLVPPVPPIPLELSDSAKSSPYEEQHFFVPGNLRDSTYSGISGYSDRTSYARTSYAPRSSVASTIYGKNAIVSPLPAQKGNFLKPSIVSVKSRAPSSSSGGSTPPVPSVDFGKYDKAPASPAFSIGSTFLKKASASTATAVRPQMVRVGSGPKTVDIKSASATSSPTLVNGSTKSDPLVDASPTQPVTPSGNSDEGPFADPPTRSPRRNHERASSSLSAVIELSTRRAAEIRGQSSTSRARSPFSDENALKE